MKILKFLGIQSAVNTEDSSLRCLFDVATTKMLQILESRIRYWNTQESSKISKNVSVISLWHYFSWPYVKEATPSGINLWNSLQLTRSSQNISICFLSFFDSYLEYWNPLLDPLLYEHPDSYIGLSPIIFVLLFDSFWKISCDNVINNVRNNVIRIISRVVGKSFQGSFLRDLFHHYS